MYAILRSINVSKLQTISNKPQPEFSNIEEKYWGASNSSWLLITSEHIRPYPEVSLRKTSVMLRKDKTSPIIEIPIKYRVLSENMMEILKNKHSETKKIQNM